MTSEAKRTAFLLDIESSSTWRSRNQCRPHLWLSRPYLRLGCRRRSAWLWPRSLAFEVIRGSRHPSEGAADASDRGRRRDPRTRVRPQKATSNQARSRRLIAKPGERDPLSWPDTLIAFKIERRTRLQRVGHGITAMISLRKSAPVHVRYGYRRVHFALPREGWNWACNRETGRRSGL